jgi:hypothetical protein
MQAYLLILSLARIACVPDANFEVSDANFVGEATACHGIHCVTVVLDPLSPVYHCVCLIVNPLLY